MKHSIATVSVSGALDSKLQAIAAAGFDAVEIFESDFISFDGSAGDVAKICRDLGLSICALQPFRDFEGMPEPQRTQNFRRAERKFDLMQKLGTDLLLICSNVSPASLGGIDRAADDLRELGERASAQGLRVGFEALAWGATSTTIATRGKSYVGPITNLSESFSIAFILLRRLCQSQRSTLFLETAYSSSS